MNAISKNNPRIPPQIDGIHISPIWHKDQLFGAFPTQNIHCIHGLPCYLRKHVIDVTNHKIIQVPMEDIMDDMLKYSKCISKAKEHHNIFKMAIMSFEHCLPFITFSNVHQLVCST